MSKLLIAGTLLACATPAFAQDSYEASGSYGAGYQAPAGAEAGGGYAAQAGYQGGGGYEPVAVDGPRVELRVGWDRERVEVLYRDPTSTYRGSSSDNGVTYGGEIGYDHAMGSVTVGGYLGVEGSTTKDCEEVFGGDSLCVRPGRTFTLGVRGGYAIAPGSLLYAKVGYSNGQVRLSYRDNVSPASNFNISDDLDGFHLGAGFELGLMRNAYAKVEYLYTDFNGYEVRSGRDFASIDPSRHQLVAGVGMRF